jgi:pentatricopeptide repeat protein
MKDDGIKSGVLRSTMPCYSNDIIKVEMINAEMKLDGLYPDLYTYNSMIGAYAKHGDTDKAEELFASMKDRKEESNPML